MLLKVTVDRLVIGRNIYHAGDVFECRDAEAKLYVAMKKCEKASQNAKATKESPKAAGTGVSVTKKPAPSPLPQRAGAAPATEKKEPPKPVPAMSQPPQPQSSQQQSNQAGQSNQVAGQSNQGGGNTLRISRGPGSQQNETSKQGASSASSGSGAATNNTANK